MIFPESGWRGRLLWVQPILFGFHFSLVEGPTMFFPWLTNKRKEVKGLGSVRTYDRAERKKIRIGRGKVLVQNVQTSRTNSIIAGDPTVGLS
ncbi:unnamed protein product [Cuscuta campestris]|uniref:Uncharacterized protein n=1 Tax=Cuscuta campestris TaxID=132261 RepID=A0A484MJF5_9ASTE|nr:unnamed protein product [Cuscuta campestris]